MKLQSKVKPFWGSIFVYLFYICQPALAQKVNISIHWKISPAISDNGKVTPELEDFYNQAVSIANECISNRY